MTGLYLYVQYVGWPYGKKAPSSIPAGDLLEKVKHFRLKRARSALAWGAIRRTKTKYIGYKLWGRCFSNSRKKNIHNNNGVLSRVKFLSRSRHLILLLFQLAINLTRRWWRFWKFYEYEHAVVGLVYGYGYMTEIFAEKTVLNGIIFLVDWRFSEAQEFSCS